MIKKVIIGILDWLVDLEVLGRYDNREEVENTST